jgi:hypothetical protein
MPNPVADDGWKSPQTILFLANAMVTFRLTQVLIEAGTLTQQQGADAMVRTANDIRSGTEDGSGQTYGEAIASRYEIFAGWLLGQNPKL